MIRHKEKFLQFMGGKNSPNEHEKLLFHRAEKYIDKIKNIRGIKMIAICNSLSMFATKPDSDIDIFIITDNRMLWCVRFWVTICFWRLGVWRRWEDIAGNFCLSFFATTNGQDLSQIAIDDDIYLYYWIYFLKPILDYDNSYNQFLQKNSWVAFDEIQKYDNKKFIKITGKSHSIRWYHVFCNNFIKFFLKRKTQKNYEKMGCPSGVIISDDILKFHDKDQRENIRENFWKKELYTKGF